MGQGAYKPRSVSTSTVQVLGTLACKCESKEIQIGCQDPFSSAPTIFQATGIAQPREATLIHNTVKRFFSVLASKAITMRGSSAGHQLIAASATAGQNSCCPPVLAVSDLASPWLHST